MHVALPCLSGNVTNEGLCLRSRGLNPLASGGAKNRILPTETGTVAPVYDNGAYVEFDVDSWKPMVPAKMLVNTELNSLEERVLGGVDRGSRLYGTTGGWMH